MKKMVNVHYHYFKLIYNKHKINMHIHSSTLVAIHSLLL